MADKSVIDAHTLNWYLEQNPRLGQNAKRIMDTANSELVLPMIALAEAVFIVESGRKSSIPTVDALM